MMKTINFITFFAFSVVAPLLLGCSPISERKFDAEHIICIDPNEGDEEYALHASKLINKVSYIPLESSAESLIGNVDKIIVVNDYLYIYDMRSNRLLKFDLSGKFFHQVGVIGEGPEEYIKIASFSVNKENNNVSIYCEYKQSIFVYDSEGTFLSMEYIGAVVNNIIDYKGNHLFYLGRLPNTNIYESSYPEQYRLVELDGKALKNEFLKFTYNDLLLTIVMPPSDNLYMYNDTVSLVEANNLVYRVQGDSLRAVYAIDFGKYNIPYDYFSPSFGQREIDVIKSLKKCSLLNIFETDDILYMYYSTYYSNMIFSAIYLKGNEQVINLGPLWANDLDKTQMPSIVSAYQNRLIGVIEPSTLKSIEDDVLMLIPPHLKEVYDRVSEDDNPIVCIVDIKKDFY